MANTTEQFSTGNSLRIERPAFPEENLVFESAAFTIWLNEKLDVWWETDDRVFNEEFLKLQGCKEWGEIMAKQTELEALPMSHLNRELQLGFRFQIGTAILLLFTGKFDQAKQTMQNAENFYKARTAEKARLWILEAGMIGVFIASTLAITAGGWAFGRTDQSFDTFLPQVILGAFCGTWGAFISLVRRASVLGVDATAGRRLHYWETICRLFVGSISGGILVCAITAGIVAPNLLKLGAAMVMIVGFSGGFSERLLPSLVGNIENVALTNKKRRS